MVPVSVFVRRWIALNSCQSWLRPASPPAGRADRRESGSLYLLTAPYDEAERAGLAARVVPARERAGGFNPDTLGTGFGRVRRSRRSGERGRSESRLAMPSRPGKGLVPGRGRTIGSSTGLAGEDIDGLSFSRDDDAVGKLRRRGGPVCRGAAVGRRK